jgi:hypothetical protein
MIECVFTLDYEVYGDGQGALGELVYEPAERLRALFLRHGVRFVNFVEVAEFHRIDQVGSDPAIDSVKRQIRELHAGGFEIGLHLHPQWCNAVYGQGRWVLDSTEYNLCTLSRPRIAHIVDEALRYLRSLLDEPTFTPISFRAGNWLFQPTQPAAGVLAERGLRVDSSVFKGGRQRRVGLDYRRSLKNGEYWTFAADVNEPDPHGALIEMPIHVGMVPFWKMLTTKRVALHNRMGDAAARSSRLGRLGDFMRFRYPLKLDFCRMTLDELTSMIERIICTDRKAPESLMPVVAIGHTKDLVDVGTVDSFLSYLAANSIPVSTFASLYPRLSSPALAFSTSCDVDS